MNEPTVDIVIVNWNSGALLATCIRSITDIEHRGYRIASVSVIDNASTDGSAKVSADGLPLKVVHNAVNLGFGAACNLGARLGDSELILFLNPDTRLEAGSLASSIAHFVGRPDVWVVGIALNDERGRVQRTCCRMPTGPRLLARALGVDRLLPSLGYVMADWSHDETRFVDHVIGAFYLVRRAAFEQVGGFDERFFVYMEDLDLSLRIRKAGGKCLFVADATAHHIGGGTTRAIKATRLFYSIRSRLQFSAKHLGVVSNASVWTASLTVEPLLRMLGAILHRSRQELAEVWSAYGQLLRWILR